VIEKLTLEKNNTVKVAVCFTVESNAPAGVSVYWRKLSRNSAKIIYIESFVVLDNGRAKLELANNFPLDVGDYSVEIVFARESIAKINFAVE
jgi:hypothetical protein